MKIESASILLLAAAYRHTAINAFLIPSSALRGDAAPPIFPSLSPLTLCSTKSPTQEAESDSSAPSIPSDEDMRRRRQKEALLGLIGNAAATTPATTIEATGGASDGGMIGSTNAPSNGGYDPVLACPVTKEPLRIVRDGPILGGGAGSVGSKVVMRTSSPVSSLVYSGRTDTYFNLLEPMDESSSEGGEDNSGRGRDDVGEIVGNVLNSLRVFIPPPIRSVMSTSGVLATEDYIPMRDLFTSPSVSFAYERGWRQGFAAAGFPGPDKEAEMVMEYFQPATVGVGPTTVVDMSCATGLFTRRLAKSGEYDRVVGCDFSESMLLEARRRIRSDPELNPNGGASGFIGGRKSSGTNAAAAATTMTRRTRLDLVRCDVGNIPMRSGSVDALHAGAAMHCWPDLDAALLEIYRVLKPEGGRYFATTFLSDYFRSVQRAERGQTNPTTLTFQDFESVDQLRNLVIRAGFAPEKVDIEVLGRACVVIRCEK